MLRPYAMHITRFTVEMPFREAHPADCDAIAALHTASWRSAYRGILPDAFLDGPIETERAQLWRERLTTPLNPRQYVLLAEEGTALRGFVCVLLDEEPAFGGCLDNLHVQPDLRGQGLGRQLFAAAARWVAATEPGWALHLWVFAANASACRFYDRLGGVVVEQSDKAMPGGVTRSLLRYLWRDLGVF
jgi:GNAT superfamily N-acetyltransferase